MSTRSRRPFVMDENVSAEILHIFAEAQSSGGEMARKRQIFMFGMHALHPDGQLAEVRRERGECIVCGMPHAGDGACEQCASRRAAYLQARHVRLARVGMCSNCGQFPSAEETSYCLLCKDTRSKYCRTATRELKEQRRCIDCRQTMDREGTRCSRCAKKQRELMAARSAARRAGRLCVTCGAGLNEDDAATCVACRAKRAAARRGRAGLRKCQTPEAGS